VLGGTGENDMNLTDMTQLNGDSPAPRVTIVNGTVVPNSGMLITAKEACRMIGVPQGGPAEKQMRRLGIPVIGRLGLRGGRVVVNVEDVERARTRRQEEAQRKADKAAAKAAPKPATKTVGRPSIESRLQTLEAKLDKLLSVWGVAE
jgi:hypothetical protein